MKVKKKIDPNRILDFLMETRGTDYKNQHGNDTKILNVLTLALMDVEKARRLITRSAYFHISLNLKKDTEEK